MKNILYVITLAILLISCTGELPPEPIRDSPYDGRNPDAVPEVLEIEFINKRFGTETATIRIETKAATEVRFAKVNASGDPLSAAFQDEQIEYEIQLEDGQHWIAAQTRADNERESRVYYQTITVFSIPDAGDERTFPLGDSGADIVMVWIPSGSFQMGSSNGEDDRGSDEGPVHTVTISEGFWLGKYEVTQGQWEAVMNDNPSHDYGVGAAHPVYYVSWDDIQGFESALDDAFRLPSESEWEYACRAGTDTRFYWGDDNGYSDIGRYAVYSSNDPGGTADVGTKLPNSWGLCDMSGNVWEWCEDWYHISYNNAPDDGSAWLSPSGSNRVRRGGCWDYDARLCRSAFRYYYDPSNRYYGLGFRLARSL